MSVPVAPKPGQAPRGEGRLYVDAATRHATIYRDGVAVDLEAQRVTSYTGLWSTDHNPVAINYLAGATQTLSTWDFGPGASVMLVRVRLPATGHADLTTRLRLTLDDGTDVDLENAAAGAAADFGVEDISDALMGDLTSTAANMGACVRRLAVQVLNGGTVARLVDIGAWRIRGYIHARGTGSVPTAT